MTEKTGDSTTDAGASSRSLTPERQIFLFSVLITLASIGLAFTIPEFDTATRPSGWWLVIVIGLGFALSERTIFHFEFGKEAIGFSVSEVPTAIALVFLAPGPAIGARIVGSAVVLVFLRRAPLVKVFFNVAMFTLELVLSYLILRATLEVIGEDIADIVVATIAAVVVASLLGSVLVSIAISFFEGDLIHRIASELRFGWWLFVVNSTLAGMALALALIAPALTLLAVVPVGAMWYLMHRYGVVNQRLRDLDAVHGFTGRVGQSLDPETIMEAAVAESASLLRAKSAALVVFDVNGEPMVQAVGSIGVKLPVSIDDDTWREFIASDEAALVDRKALRGFGLDSRSPSAEMIVSSIKDGVDPIGLLVVAGRSGAAHRFGADDVVRVQNLAEQLASSLGKGLLHQRIEREARQDALTGLPNRSAFERRVAAIAKDSARLGVRFVMLFDLDRFKEVNDTLGPPRRRRAPRRGRPPAAGMLAWRRPSHASAATSSRSLAGGVTARPMARRRGAVARRSRAPVRRSTGSNVDVTASIGVALAPSTATTADPPAPADVAMYNAKDAAARSRVHPSTSTTARSARAWSRELRDALGRRRGHRRTTSRSSTCATGDLIGAEALVRWSHPGSGAVAADRVRPARRGHRPDRAAHRHVLRGARALCRRWHDARTAHPRSSVNLSARALLDARVSPDGVAATCSSTSVPPDAAHARDHRDARR